MASKSYPPKSHAFTTKKNTLQKALIDDVAVFGNLKDKGKIFKGLWDTGATNSCINQKVVSQLNLKPISKILVKGVHGEEICDVFLVSIGLPNLFVIDNLKVTIGGFTDFDLLLGMDIIKHGDFSISNFNGKTSWSFRMPSLEETNYAEEIKLQNQKSSKSSGKKKKKKKRSK